jgi:hypothetical protein
MMKKNLKTKRKRKRTKSTSQKKKQRKTRRRRRSRKSLTNGNSSTRTSQFGPEIQRMSPRKNMPTSTNHSATIGKNTLLLSTFQLKDNSNLLLSSLLQRELLLTSLNPERSKTTSSSTSEESLSWTTARILFQNG